ncbi:hypothetical protein, partial [Micromonospora sp. ANENR4]|uniref:hypothetical protein n=1 Tax=Micromonospora sp. ANENR4 TaxID=2783662 RepID=UPI001E35B73C
LAEVRCLHQRMAKAAATLSAAVTASGATLTDLQGMGDVTAAKTWPAPALSTGSDRNLPSPDTAGSRR